MKNLALVFFCILVGSVAANVIAPNQKGMSTATRWTSICTSSNVCAMDCNCDALTPDSIVSSDSNAMSLERGVGAWDGRQTGEAEDKGSSRPEQKDKPKAVKCMDFAASADIMKVVSTYDIDSYSKPHHIKFVDGIAYLAAKNGNNFNFNKDRKNFTELVAKIKSGKTMDELTAEMKYYNYYRTTYGAALGGFVVSYKSLSGEECYGLNVYHPIAKGYYYSEFDDFGQRRSYGYSRPHQGHDFMGSTGSPIMAVEGGTIVELGWNRFGGWRIGVLSHDKTRFYYYAHLRRTTPYAEGIEMGGSVYAGQHIGYLGATGYSTKENTNMKCAPHLHFGMQVIFDPTAYNTSKEVWIDVYQLSRFLSHNRLKA